MSYHIISYHTYYHTRTSYSVLHGQKYFVGNFVRRSVAYHSIGDSHRILILFKHQKRTPNLNIAKKQGGHSRSERPRDA